MITASHFLYVSTAGRVFLRTQGAFPAVFVYRRNVQNAHLKMAILEPFISYMKQHSYNVKICSVLYFAWTKQSRSHFQSHLRNQKMASKSKKMAPKWQKTTKNIPSELGIPFSQVDGLKKMASKNRL